MYKRVLSQKYEIVDVLGSGSHAVVWKAKDMKTGELVAIKESLNLYNLNLAKRAYREIKLLQHFSHPNVISIKEVLAEKNEFEFESVYLVMELMQADLHQVLQQSTDLTTNTIMLIIYQILRALKAIHSANVIHRDLKPQNVLLDEDLNVKLCDFGTGRAHENTLRMTFLKEVATPYYRAPEGILHKESYSKSVDIWAVGCIMAEMFIGSPFFPGKNNSEILKLVSEVLGCPSAETMSKFPDSKVRCLLSLCVIRF
eukprot:TRINITY_DN2365_c0_g4_i2.p1 TRINITY_DN2365_c0_g4~~TRINITY_DN2365_c0_g4_i2.p1  ORF type:complete len:256 (+),score=28.26 TRINITY_DN2365_c0_g4_i2:10-777(+)